jgi:hypothetical protein
VANRSYKGRRFEIEIASRLSRWWTDNERDDVFWHTHDSGGRATRRSRAGKSTKNLCGDICATDPIGQPLLDLCVIEAKKGYNKYTIADLLDKPLSGAAPQEYEKWIIQAQRSAEQSGSWQWLLIVKRDKREPLVFAPAVVFELLGNVDESAWTALSIDFPQEGIIGTTIVGIHLDHFLTNVEPEEVIRLAKKKKRLSA